MRLHELLVLLSLAAPCLASPARPRLLFLGDEGHHRPRDRYRQFAPAMKKRGVETTYTDKLADLNQKTLSAYDGLVIYANQTKISKEQEAALLAYVASGKGLIALHCASYCFLNSPAYIALVGAQFRTHGTGTFRTKRGEAHPITRGYTPFESWDETYTHHKHNPKDRLVLEYRDKEPWTWVRTHGKGRVFYTAWGHDERTWSNPGYLALVERGIRWAVGGDPSVVPAPDGPPEMTRLPAGARPFKYVPAKVPFYPAGKSWGTLADPIAKMQLPLEAAESMKRMVTPIDFEVKLWADEKLLGGKPICMMWDEKGRLWAAITVDYPNRMQPKGEGRDRIVIVEDTRGAGVADKVTVFAEKLSIPTSLVRVRDGVIVHQAPETLFIQEKDGKEVSRKVLFRGWHTNDTHAGPSNLRYGLNNWIYSIVGYAGFSGTVGGEKHNFRQGFFRFRPDGSKLEFLRNTNNNSWGVGQSEEGIIFGSTANGNPSVHLTIPNRYYERVRGWSSTGLGGIAGNAPIHPVMEDVRQVDHHGHFTAAAGHALYTARAYPRRYWNRTAFVTEPTGHLAATFEIEPRGATFRSRNAFNLIASDDEWVAPIMAEVGPDGFVWVLDWYNFIVQHNPTPRGFKTGKGNAYETALRDKKHGRIYRLVPKRGKADKYPDLSDAGKMVAALKHPNMLWRLHAQRLLVERGKPDVAAELVKLVRDQSVDEIGLNVGAIHALWTLNALGQPGDEPAQAMLHPSAGVRRNAALLTAGPVTIQKGLADPDIQVRLASLLRLAESDKPLVAAGKPLAAMFSDAEILADPVMLDALTAAAAAHAPMVLEAVLEAGTPIKPAGAARLGIVARHFAATADREWSHLLQVVARSKPQGITQVLKGLAQSSTPRKVAFAAGTEEALAALLPKLDPPGKAALIRLMGTLGSKVMAKHTAGLVKSFLDTVANPEAKPEDRIAAARQAAEMSGPDDATAKQLLEAVEARTGPRLAEALLEAASAAPASGKAIAARLNTYTPVVRTAALRTLLGSKSGTTALLEALEGGKASLSDLALEQKQALAAHPDRTIRTRAIKVLARGGGLADPNRARVVEAMMPLAKKKGDAAKGKLVFKNTCAKCHKHSGEGADIGPDLTGMAAHPREELLVHIFDPSRSVEGNFRVWTVTTTRGKTYSGILSAESRTAIEIVDAEAKKTTIQREKIEQLSQSSKSLMPEGFEKQLKPADIVDLLEFLAARGKYLPLMLDKVASACSGRGMFYDPASVAERLVFPDWKPKTFSGVPFLLVDPQGGKRANVVMLRSPNGLATKMPKSVSLPVNMPARAIHFLSGVSGWGFPFDRRRSVSMIVKLTYADGTVEEHKMLNGVQFADYIRRVDVPGSKFAFDLRGKQIRYFAVAPMKDKVIKKIELVKGPDATAPVVMAVTVEGR